jgi:magnesium-transporting ATPase (P-type)
MLQHCILKDGQKLPLDAAAEKNIMAVFDQYSEMGLRMVAVAEKWNVPSTGEFDVKDESDMTLIGFVGFLDPPKESAKSALDSLRSHGIRTVVLTGDAPGVAKYVCGKLGLDTGTPLTGADVEAMDDEQLKKAVESCSLFSKLNPYQKQRVVRILQANGHTVGYMGDGINDAPPLKQANVGISVDSAVDIAKEVADIILLNKDLMVLDQGVMGGRKTFANLLKYIKMATSGNFGNMFSVVVASIFLPFLPMMPVHILVQNLLNDFAQLGMPWDHVDEKVLTRPKKDQHVRHPDLYVLVRLCLDNSRHPGFCRHVVPVRIQSGFHADVFPDRLVCLRRPLPDDGHSRHPDKEAFPYRRQTESAAASVNRHHFPDRPADRIHGSCENLQHGQTASDLPSGTSRRHRDLPHHRADSQAAVRTKVSGMDLICGKRTGRLYGK